MPVCNNNEEVNSYLLMFLGSLYCKNMVPDSDQDSYYLLP